MLVRLSSAFASLCQQCVSSHKALWVKWLNLCTPLYWKVIYPSILRYRFLLASSLSFSGFSFSVFVKFLLTVLIGLPWASLHRKAFVWNTGLWCTCWWWNDERHQKGGKSQETGEGEGNKYPSKEKMKQCLWQAQTLLVCKPGEILSFL